MARGRARHTAGIVIDRTKLGESDLILTILEACGCQARAVAKGARKPGGKLAARVQLFCELDLPRPSSSAPTRRCAATSRA